MVSAFTQEQASTLEIINIIVSVFSILGSTFVMSCYFRFTDLRNFAFYLVFNVALSDFFYSIGFFLGDAGGNDETHLGATDGLCTLQSVLISYFGLTSLFWSASIAYTLHQGFLRETPSFKPNEIEQHRCKFMGVCWCIPILFTILPFTTDSYGDTGGWCWIMSIEEKHTIWRFVQFYVMNWIAVAYNIFVFYNLRKKILSIEASMETPAQGSGSKMVSRLKMYPMVLIICHSVGTIVAFYELANGGDLHFGLNLVQVIFSSSLGFVNALVYGLTPEIKERVCKRNIDPNADYDNGAHI